VYALIEASLMQLEDIANLVGESLAISMNHGFDAKKRGFTFTQPAGFIPCLRRFGKLG
jgi:hypothetical protein